MLGHINASPLTLLELIMMLLGFMVRKNIISGVFTHQNKDTLGMTGEGTDQGGGAQWALM